MHPVRGPVLLLKNSRLFENAVPDQQVNDPRREDSFDAVKPCIRLPYERTHEAHFIKAQWQAVAPAYDVVELHVKRMGWLLRCWLSTYLGRAHSPIFVPEWQSEGYVRDADGVALMHLRRSPWVTLRPGQGIRVCRATANVQKV